MKTLLFSFMLVSGLAMADQPFTADEVAYIQARENLVYLNCVQYVDEDRIPDSGPQFEWCRKPMTHAQILAKIKQLRTPHVVKDLSDSDVKDIKAAIAEFAKTVN